VFFVVATAECFVLQGEFFPLPLTIAAIARTSVEGVSDRIMFDRGCDGVVSPLFLATLPTAAARLRSSTVLHRRVYRFVYQVLTSS